MFHDIHGCCSKQAPGATNELLVYMFTIIRAAQEFEDPAWRSYDEAFREKAAATGNCKWSEIDSLIYNRVFTGHAKKVAISSYNNINSRSSDLPRPSHSTGQHAYYSDAPPPKHPAPNPPRSDICYLFNCGSCHYSNMCKFRHMFNLLWAPPQGVMQSQQTSAKLQRSTMAG